MTRFPNIHGINLGYNRLGLFRKHRKADFLENLCFFFFFGKIEFSLCLYYPAKWFFKVFFCFFRFLERYFPTKSNIKQLLLNKYKIINVLLIILSMIFLPSCTLIFIFCVWNNILFLVSKLSLQIFFLKVIKGLFWLIPKKRLYLFCSFINFNSVCIFEQSQSVWFILSTYVESLRAKQIFLPKIYMCVCLCYKQVGQSAIAHMKFY